MKKKRLHAEIGKAIEEMFKDHLSDFFEALAHHYLLAENYEKAAEYSRLASRKAEKGVSLFRAISFAEQNIACLEKLPVTEELERRRIDARTRLGLYFIQMNQQKAKEAIDPILDLALKLNYRKRLCQIYTILGAYHSIVTEDMSEAIKTLEHALKVAEETKDLLSQVLAGHYYAGCLAGLCQFEKSAEYFRRSYEINLAAGSLWGGSAVLSTLAVGCLLPQGKIEEGFRTTEQAIELAEKSGDVFSRGTSYVGHGISNFYKGYLQEAEVQMQKGFQFGNHIPFYWYGLAQGILGCVYFAMGEMKKSKRSLAEAISTFGDHGLQPSLATFFKAALMNVKIANQEMDIDLGFLTSIPPTYGFSLSGLFFQFIGDIYLQMGAEHLTEAERWYRKGIEENEEKGTKPWLGHSLAAYARLMHRQGDRAKARENLGKAIEIMKQCGADGWVAKYEKELASIS